MSFANRRSTSYLRVRALISRALEDELPDVLDGIQALGSEILDHGDDQIELHVYSQGGSQAGETATAEMIQGLKARGASGIVVDEVEPQDWLASYREHVRPFPVGRRWWMDPHPDDPTPAPEGRCRLAIEPRMAFGTGSHESTRLILLELEDHRLDGMRVLDVGTGSGVLALAAETLGASWVVGLDIDLAAIAVAHQIAGQQDWKASPLYLAGPVAGIGPAVFDLVLCNMIPDHLDPLLDDIARVVDPGGSVVLSGMLEPQRAEVVARLAEVGLAVAGSRACGEWVALRAIHA